MVVDLAFLRWVEKDFKLTQSPLFPFDTIVSSFAELRRSLYSLYSQFGRIMDVVALKTRKMRGQAFVVFSVSNRLLASFFFLFFFFSLPQ